VVMTHDRDIHMRGWEEP